MAQAKPAGEPEIQNDDAAFGRDQDIRRFDVPMADIGGLQSFQCTRKLREAVSQAIWRRSNVPVESLSFDELHAKEPSARSFIEDELIDAAKITMDVARNGAP